MEYFAQLFESLSTWWFDLNFTSLQKRALLAMSGLIILLSIFIVVRGNTHKVAAPPVIVTEIAAPQIFVDVTGAVNNPGVYTLTSNSRVIDAIKAAGNSAPGADLSTINLARVLADGEQIYVDAATTNSKGVRVNTQRIAAQSISIEQPCTNSIPSMELVQ